MSRQPSPVWLLMNASHASRCACNELKSCSSPSSEDLRVYIAQRRVRDLACSIAALLLRSVESEEQGTRPLSSGDLARDFRERTITPAPERKSLFENTYLMADTAPFTHQHRAGLHDARWRRSQSRPVSAIIREPFQQASGRWLETAKSLFLEAIRDRARQERPADIARRCFSEHGFPVLTEFINTQLRVARNFRREGLAAESRCPPLHDRFSRCSATFSSASKLIGGPPRGARFAAPMTHTLLVSWHGASRARREISNAWGYADSPNLRRPAESRLRGRTHSPSNRPDVLQLWRGWLVV